MGGGSGYRSAACWRGGPEWLQPAWRLVPQVGLCHRDGGRHRDTQLHSLPLTFTVIYPHRYPCQCSPNDIPLYLGPSPSMESSGPAPHHLTPFVSRFSLWYSDLPHWPLPSAWKSALHSVCLTARQDSKPFLKKAVLIPPTSLPQIYLRISLVVSHHPHIQNSHHSENEQILAFISPLTFLREKSILFAATP